MLYFIPPNQKRVYIAGGSDHLNKTPIALSGGEDMHPGTDLAMAYHDSYDSSAILVYQTRNQSGLYSEPIEDEYGTDWPRIGRIAVGPTTT